LYDGLEKELTVRSRNGDTSAYAELARAYAGRVFAVCLSMLGNSHDAEDIAQQTLLNGFTGVGQLRSDEQFGAWISRIARNLCIDFTRRGKHRQRITDQQPIPNEKDADNYPELQVALAKLPEDYRLTLMLYYFDGRSTKNIAEVLAISQAAVQTRLCRARKLLRELLETGRGA
jgi:RNA polymerase sigma-70 factor (ECF subfamily)